MSALQWRSSPLTKSLILPDFPSLFFKSNQLISLQSKSIKSFLDVFIPNRKSKAGKRFAFVRFIRVVDLVRLIGNLCTLWVGRFHLHANAVCYERPCKPINSVRNSLLKEYNKYGSYASAVKDFQAPIGHVASSFSSSGLVLDDSCIIERDLSRHAMGRVKDLNSIPNLQSILTKEGFPEVKLSYLGGMWVLLEPDTVAIKKKLLQHTGVNSWFLALQDATHDFVSEERVVWVDIEGIPLNVWTLKSVLSHQYTSDDESPLGTKSKLVDQQVSDDELVGESDDEGVSKTLFGDKPSSPRNSVCNNSTKVMKFSQETHVNESSGGISSSKQPQSVCKGGSILEVLDDMIWVGHSMGYDIEGCSKDIEHIIGLISRWNGEVIIMGDFNAVRFKDERFGSLFNPSCAREFNQFISSSGLMEIKTEGYSFTWSHPSTTKMSKLDRFLVSEGIISNFLSIMAVCLDRHLSDHRPILLREIHTNFGPCSFWIYHSWFKRDGFDVMVEQAWNSFSHSDPNRLIRFKKKLQDLMKIIRSWIKDKNIAQAGVKKAIIDDLVAIDKNLDSGVVSDEMLLNRMELTRNLNDIKQSEIKDFVQKAKVKWVIEGDKNSKFFHGLINKKQSQLSIRGVFVDGDWHTDPKVVKDTFKEHFSTRFKQPVGSRLKLNISFPKQLSNDQVEILDSCITKAEIRDAVGYFPKDSNASFIALIPKVTDVKFVTNFRPISLIESVYKVITKIFANRLAVVILDLVSDTQSAFVANRQILDGPFDYLLDVLQAFGFGPNWCKWIRGIFSSAMASILINGSPTSEFSFFFGLKQGDPLAPFLFILVMESLHISVSKAVKKAVFKGLQLQESVSISLLFYADDAFFIGEWSNDNLGNLVRILKCFCLASGLKINLQKSQVLGAAPLYTMSIYKAPKGILHVMESIRTSHSVKFYSPWCSILREVQVLSAKGFDFVSHCKKRIGNGHNTRFWLDTWILDMPLSFWLPQIRSILDDLFLPSSSEATRWVKFIPIKINIFAWRVRLDRLPTRCNLLNRGVITESSLCPLCSLVPEDSLHVFSGVIWPRPFFIGSAVGGIFIGLMSRHLLNGMLGSLVFGCPLSLSLCWRVSFILLGGIFGIFGIILYSAWLLRDDQ
nr:RNA-directed DNA polymerase, eukaryota [Tanacetum cinerariifolium]